jgi:hypothetical protein
MSEQSLSFKRLNRRQWLVGSSVAALGLTLFSFAPKAQAQVRPLDAPRAAGTVGERFDGYAVTRGTVTPEITALVDKVNAERKTLYAERAKAEGVAILDIGKIYAAEIIKSAPAGTWFLAETGEWKQK